MRLFIILGGVLIACLLALWVGPRFVDWTNYRSAFETETSRLLGQPVEVRGAVSARLLPFPSIAFNDVVVGDAGDPILTLSAFRMDAELAPFLSGEVRIFNTELDRPNLSLDIDKAGQVRWPVAASQLPANLPVVFEKVRIAGGSVRLTDQRVDRRVQLSDIDADLSARSLLGPISGAGTLRLDGRPLRVSLSTGVAPGDGTLPLRVTAESDAPSLSVSLSGTASRVLGKPMLDGTVTFRTPLAVRKDKGAGQGGNGSASTPPIQMQAGFTLSPQLVALSDLRASVGAAEAPYLVTGAASLNFGPIPHFDIDLSGQEIDLDRLAPAETASGAAPSLPERIAGIREALARLPASPLPGRLRLSLPIVTIGDTSIREVSFAGSPSQEGWSIDKLSGEFPGRTLVEASGLADLSAKPGFRGSLLVAARQPASFFGWAGLGGIPALAQLDQAGLQAKVNLSASDQSLDDLELNLGGQTLRGAIDRTVRPEGITTDVELRGGAVDLEPLLALARLRPQPAGGVPERIEVQWAAGPMRYAGVVADHVEADMALSGDTLDIGSFDADGLAGADLHVEGTVANLSNAPVPDLSLDVSADEPARFLAFLRSRLPESPLLQVADAPAASLGPLALSGTVSPTAVAGRTDLVADLTGTAGGTELTVRLALENGLAAAWKDGRFGLEMGLRNEKPVELLGQLGISALDLGAPGPLSVRLTTSGNPGEGAAVSLSGEAPGSRVALEGTAALSPAGLRSLDGRLTLNSDDAALWLTTLGIAAGQGLDALPLEAGAQLRWFGGDWVLSDVRGQVGGQPVEGQLSAAGGSDMIGRLKLDRLSLGWLQTILTGIVPEGEGVGARAFAAPLLPQRPLRLSLEAGALDGAPIGMTEISAQLNSSATELSVPTFSAKISEGRLEGRGRFSNVGGLVGTEWTLDVEGRPVRLGEGENAVLSGILGGRLNFKAGGQSFNALRLSADGTGEATLTDARISAIAPNLIGSVLEEAGKPGFSATSDAVTRLVDTAQRGQSLIAGSITTSLRLANGALQIGPIRLDASGEVLSGEARIGLADRALSGRFELALPKPEEEDVVDAPDPALIYDLSGTLAVPHRALGVEPLTSYLASRAYQLEQARVRTLEEALRETVRLRRETRFYEAREKTRQTLRDARIKAEEDARRAETERRDREAAAAERRRAEEAAARPQPAPPRSAPAPAELDLEAPPVAVPPPQPSEGFRNLPGVEPLQRF